MRQRQFNRVRNTGRANHQRGGYVLVLFIVLVVGIFAMAALVIDLGFARLAQRQMQTAADAAALEGLRGADIGDVDDVSYAERQEAAALLVTLTFDDNLDTSDGDSSPSGGDAAFGAGPIVTFSGGIGDSSLHASELLTVDPDMRVYKPMVEQLSGTGTAGQFSVHLQRGVELQDADIYSNGPSLPYLFARGSLFSKQDLNRGQAISDGIAVTAKSIAVSRPAVRVGPSFGSVIGIVRVAYNVNDLNADGDDDEDEGFEQPVAVSFKRLRRISDQDESQDESQDLAKGVSIGDSIFIGDTTTPPPSGYCVIYDPATSLVVGFGFLKDGVPVDGYVAQINATANLSAASEALSSLLVSEQTAVLSANQNLTNALRAPVLRSALTLNDDEDSEEN